MSNESEATLKTHEHRARVSELMVDLADRLLTRAVKHDKSKLESPEVEVFAEYTHKLKEMTYGSDEYKQALKDMGPALDHHYASNRHHPEHFHGGVSDMTLMDLVEMICDWKAASERHNDGNILKSIEHNRKRFSIDGQLAGVLVNTVKAMDLDK